MKPPAGAAPWLQAARRPGSRWRVLPTRAPTSSCWTTRSLLWTPGWAACCSSSASALAASWQVRGGRCSPVWRKGLSRGPGSGVLSQHLLVSNVSAGSKTVPGPPLAESAPLSVTLQGPPCPAGATRLLVTHQRQYLPACDAILVMEGGRIVNRGTQAELAARGVAHVIASHGARLGGWEGGHPESRTWATEFKSSPRHAMDRCAHSRAAGMSNGRCGDMTMLGACTCSAHQRPRIHPRPLTPSPLTPIYLALCRDGAGRCHLRQPHHRWRRQRRGAAHHAG